MRREKKLVINTLTLSLGRFLPKLMAFITLPILTGCLTKKEYGQYDLIATLVMLLIPIATLQIQSAAFRFLIDCRNDKKSSSEIISNIFVVTIPITLIACFIVQFFFVDFGSYVRILIAIYFFMDTVHLTIAQITRGLGDNKSYSISAILLSVIYTISIVVSVYLSRTGLLGVIFSMVLAQVIGTIYLIARIDFFSYLSISNISYKKVKELLMYSWPMVPNNLSTWILKLSDRLVITAFLGLEANAVYAVSNKIPNVLSIAQSVMVMAWQENASIAVGDSDASDYYTAMLDRVYSFIFGCTAILIAATPILFRILIRGNYSEAYYQMPVLILAMFFFTMSSFFGGIYIAHKKSTNVGISTMAAALINLLIDFALVNVIGIWAGSISTLVAYMLLYYYRMFNCQHFQRVHVNFKKQLIQIVILIVLLINCFMRSFILNIVNAVLSVLLFSYYNQDLVKGFMRIVKKRIKEN